MQIHSIQILPWSLHFYLRAVQIPHLTALKRITQILLLLILTTLLLTIQKLKAYLKKAFCKICVTICGNDFSDIL